MSDRPMPTNPPHKFARNIAKGEQRRQDTDYEAMETRILTKLKKLPSFDLDWVECMINHLIARTQEPPEPPRMDEEPDEGPLGPDSTVSTDGKWLGFQGTKTTPMPLGGE